MQNEQKSPLKFAVVGIEIEIERGMGGLSVGWGGGTPAARRALWWCRPGSGLSGGRSCCRRSAPPAIPWPGSRGPRPPPWRRGSGGTPSAALLGPSSASPNPVMGHFLTGVF